MAELPRPAVALGFAGIIPFVGCAIAAWVLSFPWYLLAVELQTFYGACILSFLGAVHWGLAMAGYGAKRDAEAMSWQRLGWSVGPALLAWISLAFVPKYGVPLLIVGFCAAFLGDLRAINAGYAPRWYRDNLAVARQVEERRQVERVATEADLSDAFLAVRIDRRDGRHGDH